MKPKTKNAAWQLLIIILPLLIFLASLPVFFFSYTPGSAEQVEELIEVQGYPPLDEGQFYLTSVMVTDLSTVTLLQARLLGDDEVRSLKDMLGGERSYSDYNARSDVLMELSKNTASAVALREEGFEVGEEAAGVMVLAVAAGAPIASEAAVGDIIVEVNGRQVTSQAGLKDILAGMEAGQVVEVTVERGEERVTFETTLITIGNGETTPILGIYPRDYINYDLPLEITISTEDLSGPSAGLMLTLGIINIIRGGGLGGANRVAGTGEMFADGTVGPIGGINFKISAAAEEGAEVFLVPEENYAEITSIPSGLQVYPVKNLDEALSVLESLRGTQ